MNNNLWYKEPAKKWVEALPLGNGRLGAMVFGGVEKERIQLNEDTLWTGVPLEREKGNLEFLEEARKLIFSGKYKEAEDLINKDLLGPWSQSYAPMGNLYLDFKNQEEYKDYKRELNLEEGIIKVQYSSNNVIFNREMFISAPDDAIIIKLSSEEKGKLSLNISLDSLLHFKVSSISNESIELVGKAPIYALPSYEEGDEPVVYDAEGKRGMNFKILVSADIEGGSSKVNNDILEINEAESIVLKIIAYTSFNGFDKEPGTEGKNIRILCQEKYENIKSKKYDELKNNHLKDYKSLFNRVEFSLEDSDNSKLPTDERVRKVIEGEEDLDLYTLYFQYGRYLLISSSREGTQPANLQGIWNEDLRPAWSSNYTTNINVEMNYWLAEVCNLSECHKPLFEMLKDLSIIGKSVAKERYGCSGWTANHNVDLWRKVSPAGGSSEWAYWPMAGGWLCSHIWEHYEFTQDEEFLKEYYPVMKGAAEFLLDWLIEKDGYLVTCPSISPENNFLTEDGEKCSISMASTMDMAIIRNLFSNCIQAARILKEDYDFKQKLELEIKKLYPYKVGKYGQLQEWFEDFEEFEVGHRHLSHLFGLFPGKEIREDISIKTYKAANASLKRRLDNGGGHTGWSCAWVIALFARLKDSESAYKYLKVLMKKLTYSNLFNVCPPFQIDGNFGGTAAIAEMLLQSHEEYIELLPCLPKEWKKGHIKGLKARGNIEVEMEWNKGELIYAKIKSKNKHEIVVKYKKKLPSGGVNVQIKNLIFDDKNEKMVKFK